MVTLTIDTAPLISSLKQKIAELSNPDYLFRQVVFDLIVLMKRRIHEDGTASDGSQIGTYSSAYLKLREDKYNRTSDTTIIVSLTRQLENDWSLISDNDNYGIGFNNPFNTQKARWVEENKGKDIFSMSDSELDYATQQILQLVAKTFQ